MASSKKILFVVCLLIGIALLFPFFKRKALGILRAKLVHTIEARFESRLEVESIQLSVFPKIEATARNLKLLYRGRRNVPPMISIDRCFLTTSWFGVLRSPLRIDRAQLTGLLIQIPPKEKTSTVRRSGSSPKRTEDASQKQITFLVNQFEAPGAILKILVPDPEKEPLVFEMQRLHLRSIGLSQPFEFHSLLKNAKPPGQVLTSGRFGPWNKEDPGATPISGTYRFRDADLSVFKGIRGILSSTGKFDGVLRKLNVEGETETPDFAVQTGLPVALKTNFKAIIDGTSGDTLLQPIVAQFGQTVFRCSGGVTKVPGRKGKSVVLDVDLQKGRLEDVLMLAMKSRPAVTGHIRFRTKFDLPPGNQDVVRKLHLDGTFQVSKAEFTSANVQEQIKKLSQRSRGKTENDPREKILSDVGGNFILRNSILRFSNLQFSVPGALVQVAGDYQLTSEHLDFSGNLRMKATVSQTQTGLKRILLRAVDPLFKKEGAGAVLPLKITGTAKDPNIGLDMSRILP